MKRLTLAALAVLATACASAPERPDSYDYSGATAAPPAYTPAGAGAPARGQPGVIDPDRPTLPRSDQKRPLYGDADGAPAIYAADGDSERTIRLMFSEAPPATPEGLSTAAHQKCWNDVREMLRKSPSVLKLSVPEARCLRHRVWENCGQRFIDAAERGDEDFLRRYPPASVPVTTGPRAREVGNYNIRTFEEANVNRRTLRHCGRNMEYSTRRVGDLFREMTAHGDDVMGWRNP